MSKMKYSGVEWIGNIPNEWKLNKLKNVADIYNGNSISDEEKSLYEDNKDSYPYIATKDINMQNATINYENGMYTKYNDKKFKIAYSGDTLLCIEGGSAGKKIAKVECNVSFVNKLCCFHGKLINNEYLYYYLMSNSFREKFNQNLFGLIGGVSQFILKQFNICIPNVFEQELISNFLDEKIYKLDEILDDLRKQLNILDKYRDSMIYECTTFGLYNSNHNYSFKKNKWYSKTPSNWRIMPLKYLTSILTCGVASTPEYVDENEGVLFISAQNIQNHKLDLSNRKYISKSLHKMLVKNRRPKNGDILQVRVGATIGKSAIVDIDDEFSIYVSLTHIRVNNNIINKYMNYIISTDLFKKIASLNVDYAGTQGNLNVSDLKKIKIPVPPIEEQKQIVEYLDKKCELIDKIIKDKQEQITKIEEYKKSVIYEYVTGKKRVEGAEELYG